MSGKQQLIRVVTRIILPDGAKEEILQNAEGTLYLKDNDYFLRYRDVNEEEIGESWTTIKWPSLDNRDNEEQEVTIIRQGNVKMKQTFIKNQEELGYYHTPLGVFDIKTKTAQVEIQRNKQEIRIEYQLWINRQLAGQYQVKISYKDISEKEKV